MKYVSGRVKDLKVGISNYSEDKFSLDIVGIVTAGSYTTGSSSLHSTGADIGTLNVSGISTFTGNINANALINAESTTGGSTTGLRISNSNEAFNQYFEGGAVNAAFVMSYGGSGGTDIRFLHNGQIQLNYAGSEKFKTTASGISITGEADVNGDLDVDGTSLFRDNITVSNSAPKIFLTDSNNNPDFEVGNYNGGFRIRDTTSNNNRLTIDDIGQVSIDSKLIVGGGVTVTGNINANNSLIVAGALDVDGRSELDIVNIAETLNVSGISTFNALTASTLTGTLQTAAQPNLTSLGTLSSLNVSGNVTIGGTLTYEDVTNVDSVGLITARSGINVTGGFVGIGSEAPSHKLEVLGDTLLKGNLNVAGIATFSDDINIPDDAFVRIGNATDETLRLLMLIIKPLPDNMVLEVLFLIYWVIIKVLL